MSTARGTTRLRRDLRASTIDGVAYSVNVGVGEAYLAAFLLALGGGEVASGLIAAVPMLAGALLQMVSPAGVRRIGSLRRWVVLCATIQSFSFIPLIMLALTDGAPAWPVFIFASIYWGAALASGPAWNTWIGTLVPGEIRARFFARRSRFGHVAVLAGLAAGGALLQWGERAGWDARMFAVIFGVAAVARGVSTVFLGSQSEAPERSAQVRSVSPFELVRRMSGGSDARLLLYMLSVTLTVQIAGPFFTPFMLGELHFSYVEYMILIGTSFLTKFIVLPMLGDFAHRFGARKLLWLGGIGLVPLSALWMLSGSFEYLFAVQVVSGCFWGAYELASFLLLFEHIREEERTSVLTFFNFANAAMITCGSLVGGFLLHQLGQDRAAYAVLFAVSAAARGLSLLLLFRVAQIPLRVFSVTVRPVAIRPSAGSLDAPIVASIPSPVGGEDGAECGSGRTA